MTRWTFFAGAIGVLAMGVGAKYAYDRHEERKHWVRLKGFSGAVERGSIKSMKPVQLSVWRFRSEKLPETTYERLEFAIPAAYMIDKANLSGGRQKAIYLYVHWPTGDPDGFHKDLEQYNRYSAGWPREKYFIELKSLGAPVVNLPVQDQQNLFRAILHVGQKKPNPYKGKYCGWHAFDNVNGGSNTFEQKNKKSGVTSEIYFDSLDQNKWSRRISCGSNMRICRLDTHYQRFPLAIRFSPLNICRAQEFEAQTKAMLDQFLTAHHPPTRMWSNRKEPGHVIFYENSNEWTRRNLNNASIREAAQ